MKLILTVVLVTATLSTPSFALNEDRQKWYVQSQVRAAVYEDYLLVLSAETAAKVPFWTSAKDSIGGKPLTDPLKRKVWNIFQEARSLTERWSTVRRAVLSMPSLSRDEAETILSDIRGERNTAEDMINFCLQVFPDVRDGAPPLDGGSIK